MNPWRCNLSIDPLEEQFDQRLAVRQSMQLLSIAEEFAIADLLLDRVQRLDLSQRFGRTGRFRGQHLEEASAAVRPASKRDLIPVFSAYRS